MNVKYDTPRHNARIILATLYPDPNVRPRHPSQLDRLAESPTIQHLIKRFRQDLGEAMRAYGEAQSADVRTSLPQDPALPGKEAASAPHEPVDDGRPSNTPQACEELPTSMAPRPSQDPATTTLTLSIPNGRLGQLYRADLTRLCSGLQACAGVTMMEGDDIGLVLEAPACLSGYPSSTGSHRLRVRGVGHDGQPLVDAVLKFAVIPNSRDLWQNMPADQTSPYAKPESDIDRCASRPGWQLTVGSQRGRSHAHRGSHRDDHGVITHHEGGWDLLVIGDGAGSCHFSREGSRLATTRTLEVLGESLNREGGALEKALTEWWRSTDRSTLPQTAITALSSTVVSSIHAGYQAIVEEAEASGHPVKAFATTLLLAVHKATEDGHLIISFGIGDGAIAALTAPDDVRLMNTPDCGDHAGQTRFLDRALFQEVDDLYRRIHVQVLPDLEALVLATDGVTDPKFDSDNDLHNGPLWWSLFEDIRPHLVAPSTTETMDPLLAYLDFFVERHHDDRTIALLHRRGGVTDAEAASTVGGGQHD